MSLAFDEYGRPFIIIRVRARGRRDPSGVAGFPVFPVFPVFRPSLLPYLFVHVLCRCVVVYL
jgi:hypothetical protein